MAAKYFLVQNGTESRLSVFRIADTHQETQYRSKYCSHYHSDNYCSPLPHKHSRSVVHSVNTVQLTAVQRAFCKRLYTEPAGPVSIYAYCKDLSRLRAFLQFVFSLVQLLAVFVLASRAAHKNQHFISCIISAKCTVCSLLPLSSPNTE